MSKFKYLYLGGDFSVYGINEISVGYLDDFKEGVTDILDISGETPMVLKNVNSTTGELEWAEIPEAGKGIKFEDVCRCYHE